MGARCRPPGGIPVGAIAEELSRHPDELSLLRSFNLFNQDGWIEADYELGAPAPIGVWPLPKTLSAVRGWPGGDSQAAGERLIAALEELIAREPGEARRSKLSQVRDFLLELGSKTLRRTCGQSRRRRTVGTSVWRAPPARRWRTWG
ncbi:MAG TPA: hypothetical protein VGL78_15745 [Solirubrobacteraceae bacterium]